MAEENLVGMVKMIGKKASDCSMFCLCDALEAGENSNFTPDDGSCSEKSYIFNQHDKCSYECRFYGEVRE